MSQPTLILAASTITLPWPAVAASNVRTYDEVRISRRTLDGLLRTTVLSSAYRYELGFRYIEVATYDAIITMWVAAVAALTYPTFTWVDGPWPSAVSGVTVAIEISPMLPAGPIFGFVDFGLTLTEVNPR